MQTVKITAEVAKDLENALWVIVYENVLVGSHPSRSSAREAAAKGRIAGSKILKKEEVNFEVINSSISETKPVAPIGQEIENNVHDYTCPHCGTDLENGVGDHLQDVNGKQIKHDQYIFECLACGGEFGPAIAAKKEPKAKTARGPIANESTIERPCKKVWEIADNMKGQKRGAVLAECVNQGIAFYTARTQYQQWLGIQKEMAAREASKK